MDVLEPLLIWLNIYLHLFPFQVRPLILLSSLFYSVRHFVKGLIKTDHNLSGIFIHSFIHSFIHHNRSSLPEVFCKKGVLRNFATFTGKHLCHGLYFNKVVGLYFIKKETLAQVFSCKICEFSNITFSNRTPPVAACGSFMRYTVIL